MTCSPKESVPNGNRQELEVKKTVCHKRALEDSDGPTDGDPLSKNKQKKKARNPNKNFCPEQKRKINSVTISWLLTSVHLLV